jgi:predicted nucleic acid-binding Zn finger protein
MMITLEMILKLSVQQVLGNDVTKVAHNLSNRLMRIFLKMSKVGQYLINEQFSKTIPIGKIWFVS